DPTDVLIRFNPIQIGEEMDWSFVSAGDGFNIGSRTDLSLWSWGNNGFGQLGGGDQAYRGEPGLIDLDFIPHPPVITSAPKSLLMDLGKNAVFQVNVLGPGSIHYQWYHDGIPLEGATESILQVNRVQLENGGDYRVAVSNEYGEITSSSASLTVVDRVQITRHPENQTVPFGAEVSFYVEADFIGNVQYEWRLSGRLIPDSNDPVLMLDKVSTQDEGRYTVRIRNEAGVAVSKEAVLTVLSPPVIISGPSSREIERADNIFLSVFAIGAFPLQHQWFKDGVPIPDANSSLLSLRGVQESDEGVYSVRVENVAGAVTSFPAQILVNQAPVIGEQPVDLIVDAGQSARFSVQPQKGVSLKYQWFFNEIEIPGTAGNSFTLQSVTYEDVGNYSVRIQNSIGFVESRNASLKIKELPGISPTEETSIVSVGSQVVWEVHPESKFPVSYQWFFNNELLSRQTSSRLELQNLSRENAGTYYVRISNEFGSIDGPLMNLVVVNASGPGRIASGETVDFEVEVFGAPDAVVQLRRNGMPLIPQPDASFRIENITLQDSGLYQVSIQAFQAARTIDLARLRVIGEFLRFSNQFEDRIALDPAGGIGQTYMIRAGRESGEPDHAGKMGGRSIWYSWKASANGMAFLKTLGSELDTRIAVYRGEGLTELTPVVSDDDSGGFFSSVVEFPVQQDEVFAIAVAHGERRNGRIVLEWGISDVLLNQGANLTGRSAASALPPTSPEASSLIHYGKFSDAASFLLAEGLDESAVPVRLPGDEDRIVFSNLGSSVEFGEPLHCNQIGGASKWMVFRVGEASWTTVEATGQQFGTVAAVYELTRDEFKDLSLIVCSPPGSTDRPVSKIGFQARPGNYYALVVDSLASASDEIEVELQFEASKHFSIIPTDLDSMRNETVEFLLQPELEEGDQIEWVKNGVVLPDREQSLLKLSNLLLRDTGIYQARITTTAGVVLTSATSSLKVSDLLVIDDQPDDIRAVIGSSAAFSILARGEGSLNYQWTLNGEELAGADTARLAFGPALPENEGVYQVLVTDRNGSLLSNTVELDILHPAKILSQSSGSGAGAGNEVILAVEFEGSPPHRIEWFYQGNLIPGAVESELVLPDFQREDAGDYQVVISSAGSEAVSPPINVSFRGKPEVLVHPISMEIPEDAAAFFSVSASGKGPFAYQWFLNDELLIGEIRADLYVPDAGISNQGLYRVNVSNPGGSVLSLPADLSILMAPEITVPPLGFAVNAGDLVLLHVEALGSPVLEYQWFVDGSPIQGAQESLLIFTASGISQGSYQVMVSNRVGFAKSAEVDLVVAQPLVIIKQPLAKVVLEGDSVSFSVEVTGQRPFVFQWFKNGLPIENATQNVLEMSSVVLSDVADYSVSIFNESGSVTSQVALLAIQRLSRIRIADFFSEFGLNILTLEWNSLPGRTYQVDVSTDLLTWEPLSNLTAFAKLTQIVDILNAAQLIRFYRLTEVP
ncbi:MAG TPA: hypothetical protein EYQ50_25825, partial [Verrucomicrobiales bacterium]|nr:hypothetical protein [Verrucomicrobiales bacterium]